MSVEKKLNKNSYLSCGLLFARFVQRSKYRMYNSLKKSIAVAYNFWVRSANTLSVHGYNQPEGGRYV
mgnify:CR=1 FL=1